eukprot:gene3475-3711_t
MFTKTPPSKPASSPSLPLRENSAALTNERKTTEWAYIALDIVKFTVSLGLTVYLSSKAIALVSNVLGAMNQENVQQLESKKSLAKRLKRPDIVNLSFNSYESRLLTDVLGSDEISVTFADVGGLDSEIEEVFDSIVFPIQLWNHRQNAAETSTSSKLKAQESQIDKLVACPTGVLLYGAPGTGKTLIAKAIAKESGATFINIKASSIGDKWFGESDRLVSALFSLARKLAPSVIFIDEVETLLRKRDGLQVVTALASLQGVFLSEWDGIVAERSDAPSKEGSSPPPPPPSAAKPEKSKKRAPVVVLGATNRPSDIDAAFLRRMPVQIRTQMPNSSQRRSILAAMLREENVDSQVSLDEIAERTEGFSGSDLRELVRLASAQRVKEMKQTFRSQFLRTPSSSAKQGSVEVAMDLVLNEHQTTLERPLLKEDFEFALQKSNESGKMTRDFNENVFKKDMDSRLRLFNHLSSQTKEK